MKYLLLLLSALIIASCARKAIPISTERSLKDSSAVKVSYIPTDTLVSVPGDSIHLSAKISGPDMAEITKKGKQAVVRVRVENNNIIADCICTDLQMRLTIYKKIIETYRSVTDKLKEVHIQEKKYVPWFIRWLAYAGAISLISLGGFICYKKFI